MAKVKTAPKTKKKPAPVKKPTPKKAVKTKSKQSKSKTIPPAIKKEIAKIADEKIGELRRTSEKQDAVALDTTFEIDFCGIELSIRRRTFLRYYLIPGSPTYNNAMQSAIKAGYSEETARARIHQVLCEPDMEKIVRANEGLGLKELSEAAKRAIKIKIQRAEFDPIDYFEEKEIIKTDKDGESYTQTIMALKDLKTMTPEQRMAIDGIEYKGYSSNPAYIMANRDKSLDDVIKINKERSGAATNEDGEAETMEIIMERLTLKKTVRQAKDEISQIAGLIRVPKGEATTEL